ncbi:hypothetical protein IFM89_023067 [Coptis chinensis]|uniref:Late embryogenesis abundant protein LEA-2 subgroup domain-containing protein n=1 Tax=Coptis chinensis TaxID=261450 RepID=A0A835ICQ6_9MAGN|nr:hypothetical protein IFM89_023067 [Coptis chinensis]
MHAKSESDVTSLAPSSPSRSPKRHVYYVQSPSRDSHDGDKSSSMQATPVYNSPMESPSHPSYGRHSRASSASRFSGPFRSSSGRKGNRKRNENEKGWPECDVIQEEGSYDDLDDRGLSRRCQALVALLGFVLLFTVFSLIIWGASRPYKAEIVTRSLTVNNLYFGEGSDATGVPTKMLTVNCSLKMSVYNPASFFGIHVSSTPVNLIYSEITVATGAVTIFSPSWLLQTRFQSVCEKCNALVKSFITGSCLLFLLATYFQPRKSRRVVTVNIEGTKVPLYGAGSSFAVSDTKGGVPLTLEFGIRTRGYVVGKLVKTRHQMHITCPILVDSTSNKPMNLKQNSCRYD